MAKNRFFPNKNIVLNRPQDIAQLFAQGLNCHKQGDLQKAKEIYQRVLALSSKHFDALHLIGVIFAQTGAPERAFEMITRAIKINPNYPSAYYNRGFSLLTLKRFEEAIVNYDRAIALNPQYAEAYCNRAIALNELKRVKEAILSCEHAITINPEYADAHYNLGVALQQLDRFDEAIISFDRAISLKPDHITAYSNRGAAFQALKNLPEALRSYENAISIDPTDAYAQWNKAIASLLGGDFKNGWSLYEWRWKNNKSGLTVRDFEKPLWHGDEDLCGVTILIHSEQGLGDSIQFCRYCEYVKNKGARVILEVQSPLTGLMRDLAGVDAIIRSGEELPPFDYHCPLLSLPLAFNTDLDSIPAKQKYLSCSADKREFWSERLGHRNLPRVGLVWSGSRGHTNDHNRSIRLAEMLEYLPHRFEYVSLQIEAREADKDCLGKSNVKHYGDEIIDFSDTAALCELMELIICVDTSVAHLAAALGKKTWLILPYVPDWRWMLEGDTSPWYHSMRLYRQTADKKYSTVLDRISNDMQFLDDKELFLTI
jgi:tetratricopeptide (TPR) repeat protein